VARVGIAVGVDAIRRPVAASPRSIAVGIAQAAVPVSCRKVPGIGTVAAVNVTLTTMNARTPASDGSRRTRKASGPRTKRTAGTRETSKTTARETGRSAAGERRRATGAEAVGRARRLARLLKRQASSS